MLIMVCDRCGKARQQDEKTWYKVTTEGIFYKASEVNHVCGECLELMWVAQEKEEEQKWPVHAVKRRD